MAETIISATILEDEQLNLEEFSRAIHVENNIVIEMIEYRLIEPIGNDSVSWRFNSYCLRRAKAAVNLQRDLDINLSGVSLALDLLEKIENLQNRLAILERQLKIF